MASMVHCPNYCPALFVYVYCVIAEMVMISGRVIVMEGRRVELRCLRESDDQPPTSSPQWSKDESGTLPAHVTLV